MKRIFISTAILLITFMSCEDFLDVIPETSITEASFYGSQTDFEQAVIGVYQPLQDKYDTHYQVSEMRSDNAYFQYDLEIRSYLSQEEVATFDDKSTSIPLQVNWIENYKIIARANAVLKYIDNATFSQNIKDNLKGQALFLRALSYFDLVCNFGDVPLFLEPAATIEETFKARSASTEVYDQIITDAVMAADLLPDKSAQTAGKATSGAAYMLIADVYLTQGQWGNAEDAIENVLGMGYELLPEYRDVFDPANKNNNEIIFEVQYTTNSSQNLYSNWYWFLPDLNDIKVIIPSLSRSAEGGNGFNVPTPDIIEAYEDTIADERFKASIAFYSGPSARSGIVYDDFPYVIKYLYPHTLPGEMNQNWPVYRYSEALLMYAEVLNEQDRLSEALPFLNEVRNRAGLNDTTALNKSQLRDIILHERRIELAFENKRWHDLVRTGNAISVMTEFGERVKANPESYYYPEGVTPFETSFNVTQDKMIFPIPVHELITNPSLVQNPGY